MLRFLAAAFLIVVVLAALAVTLPWFEVRDADRDIRALASRLRSRTESWPDDAIDARAVALAQDLEKLDRTLSESGIFDGEPSFEDPWPDDVWDRATFFLDGVEAALLSTRTATLETTEFPFLPALRAASIFCHRARRNARRGEHADAALDLGIAFEIGGRIDRAQPSVIGLIVATSIENMAAQTLVACAQQAGSGTPYLALLEGRLVDSRVAARTCAAYRGEVRFLVEALGDAATLDEGQASFDFMDLGAKALESREEVRRLLGRHLHLADLEETDLYEAIVSPEQGERTAGLGLVQIRSVARDLDLGRAVCIAGLRLSTRDDARLADVLPASLRGLVRLRTGADGRVLEPAEDFELTEDVREAFRWHLPR